MANWDKAKYTISVFLFPLIFLAGIFKITLDKNPPEKNHLEKFLNFPYAVGIKGIVTDPPRKQGKLSQFVVDGDTIVDGKNRFSISGSILVRVISDSAPPKFIDSLEYGTFIEFSGMLSRPGTARNPGEFDLRNYLQLKGIFAQCLVDDSTRMLIDGRRGNWFLASLIYPLRRSISHFLDSLIGGEESKFLRGLAIGDRSEISPEVKTSFINSGVMHILAVSGLHVGLITIIFLGLLNALRIPEKPKVILLCAFLIFYIFLTGSAPSVVRAVVMAIVVLGAKLFERKSDILNSLAFAALVVLMVDAQQLFMAGFQLSFAAVLSIALLYPKFYSLEKNLPETLRQKSFVKAIFSLICVSLSAGLGTLPFTSFYFGKIPVIGLLANLVIVPMSGIVLALGVTTIVVSFLWTSLASFYAEAARLSASVLLESVKFFGNLSFSYVDAHFTLWQTLIYYALLVVVVNVGWFTLKRFILFILVLLNLVVYGWLFGLLGNSSQLRITFLDVGQGDAIFLECPDGKNILIDAGPRTLNTDAGRRFIIPFLKGKRVAHLDVVVVSHPHSDHLGGIPTVLRHFSIGQVIDAGSIVRSFLFTEYSALLDSLHTHHVVSKAGESLHGFSGTRLYILHPSGSFALPDSSPHVNLNNQSLAVRVVYGSTSALLVGDVEEEAESRMMRIYDGFLQSNLLKVGHHGSNTSSSDQFLEAVKPQFAVISVGRHNKFHHPSAIILKRFADRHVRTYRTDVDNAVVFVSDGYRWNEQHWK